MTRAVAFALFVASIIAANVLTNVYGLVSFLGLTVTAGTFAAGFALLARDYVQVTGGRVLVAAAITTGAVLSFVLSNPQLAIASTFAFAVSELLDTAVFSAIRPKSWAWAVIVSSLAAAPVDTVLFLWVAGFPVTPSAVAGQVIVKTAMALAAVAVVKAARR